MVTAGITIGCVVALITASGIVFRLRRTTRTPSPLTGTEPLAERLAVTAGRTGGMLLGAYIAGVLTIGAGARLMMRILAATSPAEVQGLRTDADEIIGDVTFGGSMFLIVVVGIGASLVGLALFASLRSWLPDRSLVAGFFGCAVGAGVLVRPAGLISSANPDFTLVAPVVLAVALCIAVIVLFGVTFGVLVDCLASRWPRPGWSVRGVVSVLPFGVLLLAPPLFVVAVAAVLVGTFVPTGRRAHAQPPVADKTHRVGRAVMSVAALLGAISVVVASGQVLAV